MRVLVISRMPPHPLNSGGTQRTRALIEALATRHEVIFSGPLEPDRRDAVEAALHGVVSRFVWSEVGGSLPPPLLDQASRVRRFANYATDFVTHLTPLASRTSDNHWEELLQPELAAADAVICRHASVFALTRSIDPRKVVVDADDLMFLSHWQTAWTGEHGMGSILVGLEAVRGYLAEQWLGLRCAQVLVASAEDAKRILTRRKTIVANGITFDDAPRTVTADPRRIAFIGDCAWEPNTLGLKWFVEKVWPAVKQQRPDATLAIGGRSANHSTLPFADRPGITLAEDVPSARTWLESAAVSVVPLLRGAGTRIKIVESLAYGIPVVSTRVGAAGLTDRFSRDHGVRVVADAAEMSAALVEILTDSRDASLAAQTGKADVRATLGWHNTTLPLATGLTRWIERR